MSEFYSAVPYLVTEGGTGLTYNIPFPYLLPGHVYVFVNNVQVLYGPGVDGRWEFVTPTQVKVNKALVDNDKVWVRRITRKDQRLAEYFDGSVLTEGDLNSVTLQLLYLIQEMIDYLQGAHEGTPIPGGPGGGFDGDGSQDPPDIIDEIIAELLNSQLFQDLVQLIELTDINAETIVSHLLQTHEQWRRERQLRDITGNLNNGIVNLTQTVQNANEAFTLQITSAVSRIGAAESRLGTIESTYATREYAETLIHTEILAAFEPESLDGYLNAAGVIQAIRTRADAQEATAEGITSYIAGSGVTINPDGTINWGSPQPGSLAYSVSVVQTTVNAHSTQLLTEAAMRTALASHFSPGNQNNPVALVAAIEDAWQTYADEDSATATRVTTLEVNRQPIFFRATAPNPYADEFAGTPFATTSFPTGSIWWKQVGNSRRPYYWYKGTSAPGPTTGMTPDVDYYAFNQPPYTAAGMWWPSRDTNLQEYLEARDNTFVATLGAQITNLSSTRITADQAEAIVENTLVTAFGTGTMTGFNAISERLTSLVDLTDGLMYSAWHVRINQQLGAGTPVVAGVGLGMQADLNNPNSGSTSQFIVMADKFALVKPVSISGDPTLGNVDLSTVQVPFVIDSQRNKVIINSTLLARSVSLLDGYAGRLTFTQLNPTTYEPVNPSGMRLVLPSSTNNWNASNGASPFTGTNPQRFLVWAGSGTMNHNNAIFYVDTEGNASFGGVVQADNINGAVGGTALLSYAGSEISAPGGGGSSYGSYQLITSTTVPEVLGGNARTVAVSLVASMRESSAGPGNTSSGKLKVTAQPAGESEVTLADMAFVAETRGDLIPMIALLTAATRKSVTVRVYFCGFGSTTTYCGALSGYAQGIR